MRHLAFLLSLILLAICIPGHTESVDELSEWADYIVQQYANVAAGETLPVTFYQVKETEETILGQDGIERPYTRRMSKFTIGGSNTGSFTIIYSNSRKDFSICFPDSEKPSIIRDFFCLTLKTVFGSGDEKANELTSIIVSSYDGTTRSDFIYSDDFIVFLCPDDYPKGTELRVVERKWDEDADVGDYKEMDYSELTSYLNQGDRAFFHGTFIGNEKGREADTLTIQLADGNTVPMLDYNVIPHLLSEGEEYTFYVAIAEKNTLYSGGELVLHYVIPSIDK